MREAVAVAVERRLRTILDAAAQRCRRRRGKTVVGRRFERRPRKFRRRARPGAPRRSLVATLNGSATLEPKELDLDAVEAERAKEHWSRRRRRPPSLLSWLAVDGRDAREDAKTKELKTPPLRREQEPYVRAVDDAILGKCDDAETAAGGWIFRRDAGLRPLAPHLAALAHPTEAAEAHKTSQPCKRPCAATFIRSLAMGLVPASGWACTSSCPLLSS